MDAASDPITGPHDAKRLETGVGGVNRGRGRGAGTAVVGLGEILVQTPRGTDAMVARSRAATRTTP